MAHEDSSKSSNFERSWKKRFGQYADARDDDAGIAGWTQSGLETRVRNFDALWTPSAEARVWLDAGCGAGTYSRFMVSKGRQVIGLDYCYNAVKKAVDRSSNGVVWGVADVKQLPIAEGSFDGAICFGVTQALSASSGVSRELAAVVKPGGEIWIDALNSACLPHLVGQVKRKLLQRDMHLRYESPRQLRRAMADAGIVKLKRYWIPILPYRFHRYQWVFETKGVRWLLHTLPMFGALLSHGFVIKGYRQQ